MPPTEPSVHYRADIDGLRAIAVLSVFAFHLHINLVRGGFVGVDIFFVISGYLIGSSILSDLAAGKFTFARFYERRVRRIFPAMFVAFLGTALLAYHYFLPSELVAFAKSMLAALLSVSNIFFWMTSGYFSAPAETKPLLHTWSLAIEEQFYVFLPIFLILAHRFFPRRLRASIIAIAVASFVASSVAAFTAPSSAYFLLHTRAWELLIGVLIALGVFPQISSAVVRNAVAAGGLLLILVGILRYAPSTPFPGVAALAPCLGTALIIASGRNGTSLTHRLLALKPLVFVGLISYSLYLWHWPIIVFQGLDLFVSGSLSMRTAKLLSIVLSFIAAALSWRFVEVPFRHSQKRLAAPALFRLAAAVAVVIAVVGFAAIFSRGAQSRYPTKAIQLASYLDYDSTPYFREGTCFITSAQTFSSFDPATCLAQDPHRRNFLLFGDSHAAQLWYGLSTTLPHANVMQATVSGCKPLLEQSAFVSDACTSLVNYIYKDYLPSHHVDRVLIAARWQDKDLVPLSHVLDWMAARGIQVVLFGPMVQYDAALPRLLAFSIRGNDPGIPDEHRLDERALDASLSQLAQARSVDYISFYRTLCGPKSCEELAPNDVPLQFDYGHLTKEGSVLVVERVSGSGDFR
jgi:peptidoglycan/LPS O-acetylase OafA/YrhL